MISRWLAVALLIGGCGEVARTPGDAGHGDGGVPDAKLPDAAMPVAYQGSTQQTQAVPFGGTPYCNYTITLKRLQIDLSILPSGLVTNGMVQNLNVEATDVNCPNGVIPATMAYYTLQSAVANGSGTKLTFQGNAANNPTASLDVDLTRSGTSYSTVLNFHRIDQPAPLDWKVMATLPLAAQ